jgi:hypothetical protein
MGAPGGSISYAGTSAPLKGTLAMTSVRGDGTPQNSGIPYFVDATLTFETGEYKETSSTGDLIFKAGGHFNIFGSISFSPTVTITDALLLKGEFLGASFDPTFGRTSLALGTGTDTKHPELVNWFFGDEAPAFEFSGTIITPSVNSQLTSTNSFSTYAKTASIVNVAVSVSETSALPELLLMLVGMGSTLAVAKAYRRRTE